MAGRGAAIRVRLPVTGEEHSLTVGLHTPLGIFRTQLAQLTGIAPQFQVLQLLDLRPAEARDFRDPDNVLLEDGDGRAFATLGALGVAPGATLQLHSLAPPTPGRGGADDAEKDAAAPPAPTPAAALRAMAEAVTGKLDTRIAPRDANHSFAGVLWDVESRGPAEVVVTSVWVGGMLGRVRVFARDGSWRGDEQQHAARLVATGWGTRYDLDPTGWALVADEECLPSWDVPREIRLTTPVRVLPHHRRALFVHSNLPDDLGIQYQSYGGEEVIAQDAHVALHPGLGFTGAVPFDTRRGWYRAYRGPAGSVGYSAAPVRWSAPAHAMFPAAARAAVRTCLLAQRRPGCPLAALPKDVLLAVLEHCHWDWFVRPNARPPRGGTREGGGPAGAAGGAGAAAAAHADDLLDSDERDSDDESDGGEHIFGESDDGEYESASDWEEDMEE